MKTRIQLLAVVLALAGGPAAVAAEAPSPGLLGAAPVYREIKDWVVVCDNSRACFAKYQGDEMTGSTGYLSVSREAGPGGRLVVSIEDWDGDHPPDRSTLRLDGKPVPDDPSWASRDKGDVDVLEGVAALRFLQSVDDGRTLRYGAEKRSAVSLAGLKAALLVMDEDQGRLGVEDAFVRIGPKPATSAAAAMAIPVLHAAPPSPPLEHPAAFAAAVRRAQAAILKKKECETPMKDGPRGDEAFALGRADVLILLDCIYGAYQVSSVVFRAPRGAPDKARLLLLPLPPTALPNPDGGGDLVSADWDPKRSVLSEHSKGRGIADCGDSTQWVFDGERFRVASYNSLGRCTGGPPGDWPTVYRTRVVVGP
jgi:hypothetical protein